MGLFSSSYTLPRNSLVTQMVKSRPAMQETWVQILGQEDPTPIFLSGESHERRSLVGYSLQGHKESDTVQWLNFHFSFSYCSYILINPHFLKSYKNLGDSVTLYQSFVIPSVIAIFVWRITKSHQKTDQDCQEKYQ